MLPKKSIEDVLHVTPCVSDKMADAIQLWADMYEGHSPWLKEPNYYDPVRIVSLGLPALIASEKARMVTIEMKTEISTPVSKSDVQDQRGTTPLSLSDKGQIDSNLSTQSDNSVGATSNNTIQSKDDGEETKKESERVKFLRKQYKKVGKQLRRQLEYGIAKGGLVIKPYIVMHKEDEANGENTLSYDKSLDKAEIEFDFIQADRFFPLSFDANGKVVEAAFVQTKVDRANERVFIRLEYHKLVNRTVTVTNLAFESTDMSLANTNNVRSVTHLGKPIPLTAVPEWAGLQPTTTISNVDRLLFAYFRMPEANTVDPYSFLGVSGYSRVIQLIKDADMQYSRMLWEFEAGEMAIDVDQDAMNLNEYRDGKNQTVLPEKQQRLFRKIDLNAEDTYNVFAPPLRDTSLINGLNSILMRIEDATGLSRGTLSDVTQEEAKTATELKILKQRSFATNKDIQMALQDALEDVVYVMDVYCTLYEVVPEGEYEVSFEWDDSIIVDSESELSKRITLMQNGLSSRLETRMWYFGETESQARNALAQIDIETEQKLAQTARANAISSGATNDEGEPTSPSDTTGKKISQGKQADVIDNPNKSKAVDGIKSE